MSATLHWNAPASTGLRVGAGAAVVLLHAAVVGAIFAAQSDQHVVEPVETIEVRFVEIAPQVQVATAPPAPTPPAPEPEPAPRPVPEPPKPKPKPKPKPAKPVPKQEIKQPPPEPLPPSETALTTQPAPEPEPTPAAEPAPVADPAPAPVASSEPPSGKPEASDRSASPQAPVSNEPKLVGRIEYLGPPPMPEYPRASRRLGEEGKVLVRLLINARGLVDQATLEKSSGFRRLDDAALEAAKRGRFKPYTENGVAMAAIAIVPFDFTLRN